MSAVPSAVDDGRAVDDDLVGSDAGPYRLLKRLGKGGDGAVYLGEDPLTGWRAAIKFLHQGQGEDPAALQRFFNEAHAAHLLGHENIVRITDLDRSAGGRHFLVMELLDGEPLDALIARSGPLPLDVSTPIALQCCAALAVAHERSIVHADLKPENIFLVTQLGRERFVKIVDFGMAQLDGGGKRNVVFGTPWYMSPEQALGERFDRRSDIYSLGVILYEMATGRVPFPDPDPQRAMVAHVDDAPPLPRSLRPSLSSAYEAFLLRLLAKDPADRPQSMAEVRGQLLACVAPPQRRRARMVAAALAWAAAVAVTLGVLALRERGADKQELRAATELPLVPLR